MVWEHTKVTYDSVLGPVLSHSQKLGTLNPRALALLYPFNTDITHNHIHHQHITPMSPCDAPMMSCSFLVGNPHACIQMCEQKYLAQSMSACVTTPDLLLWGQRFIPQVHTVTYVLFSTQMWPENQVSRVPGEVEHQETLFVMFSTKKSELKCFKLIQLNFVCTVPETSTVLVPTQMWPENKVSREYITLNSLLELYTLQFGFCSIRSLHTACEVSTVFIVVDSTQKWPETKYLGSYDA